MENATEVSNLIFLINFIVIFSSSFIISHFMIFEYFRLGLSMDEPGHTRVLLELISSKLFDRMFI